MLTMPEIMLLATRALITIGVMEVVTSQEPILETLGPCDVLDRLEFVVRRTLTKPPKFLPYRQRFFVGNRNCPVWAGRDEAKIAMMARSWLEAWVWLERNGKWVSHIRRAMACR